MKITNKHKIQQGAYNLNEDKGIWAFYTMNTLHICQRIHSKTQFVNSRKKRK